MRSIEETMKFNVHFAKKTMQERGDVSLMFLLHTEEGTIPMVVPNLEDEETKTGVLQLAQLLMLKNKAYAYSVVMEAWLAQFDSTEEMKAAGTEISKHPKRKEVLLVSYISHDRNDVISIEVKRPKDKKGKISFGKPVQMNGMEGRFFELLPPAKMIGKELTAEQSETLEVAIGLIQLRYQIAPVEVVNDELR